MSNRTDETNWQINRLLQDCVNLLWAIGFAEMRIHISHRCKSLDYHLNWLLEEIPRVVKRSEDSGLMPTLHSQLQGPIEDTCSYYLDDIVFNSVSMFDYLAGFLMLGVFSEVGQKEQLMSVGWTDLERAIVNEQTPRRVSDPLDITRLEGLGISESVRLLHRSFVGSLVGYRNDTIHNHTAYAPSSMTHYVGQVSISVTANAPQHLNHLFPSMPSEATAAAEWLVFSTYESVARLLETLVEAFGQLGPPTAPHVH